MPRLLLGIFFLLYMITVSYFCLSAPEGIKNIGSLDKLAHTLTYIGFSILSCLIASNRKQVLLLLTACTLYGIGIEYLQGLTSYRTASLNDVFANITGLSIGFMISKLVDHFSPLAAFGKSQ